MLIEKLSYHLLSILNLFFSFSLLNQLNNKNKLRLFLYKRNIEYLFYYNRVFIKYNTKGQSFLEHVIKGEGGIFKEYIRPDKKTSFKSRLHAFPHRPKNEFIARIFYNNEFEFEFIPPKYWDHLKYTLTMLEEYDLPIHLDALFTHYINTITEFKVSDTQSSDTNIIHAEEVNDPEIINRTITVLNTRRR